MRAFAKAATYRFVSTMTTIGVVYAVSANLNLAAQVGVVETLAKLALYVAHEYMWDKIGKRLTGS